jgi:DMSO/TMAO reductase YedYZ molybdopterin-dependent catalytic subunit
MDGQDPLARLESRRQFVRQLTAGTSLAVLGGVATCAAPEAQARMASAKRSDGRPRLPPGQRLLSQLKPMGGQPGDASRSKFRLRVHGEVQAPFELDFRELLAMPQSKQSLDVHCVTGWSMLDGAFEGVQLSSLAERAKVKSSARHVIFEAAHGYTANVRIQEALAPQNMLAHRLGGKALAHTHGGPVRGLVPDLYFWKSPKWITGIRFVRRDEPGYWEVRGYHNHADPWREERHS